MKLELQSASNFLVHLVRLGRRNINETQLDKFRNALIEALRRRYRDHWFPEKPFKGSGYRCIRINGKMDPVISQAGESCGLSPQLIHSIFPSELTMWIDPREVSYRIGENGSICVLYEHKEGSSEPWQPNQHGKSRQQTSSTSSSSTTTPSSNSTGNSAASSASPSPTNDNEQAAPAAVTTCKDLSLRKMDYLLDPRKSVSIEQLAAYVGSA